jgi:cytochrome b561
MTNVQLAYELFAGAGFALFGTAVVRMLTWFGESDPKVPSETPKRPATGPGSATAEKPATSQVTG